MHIKFSIISKVLSAGLLVIMAFFVVSSVSAQTVQFNNNLYWNIQPVPHPEVKVLQQFLKDQGLYVGDITGNYLTQTYDSVMAFQTKYGISPVSGYFGPDTRVVANKILSGGTVTANTPITLVSSPTPAPTTNTTQVTAVAQTTSTVPQTITTTTTTATNPNLVLNPSMETANGTKPDKWAMGKWGTNTTTFTYPVSGQDGSKGANVKMTAYTSGDAKWFFDDIIVTPGKQYVFTEYYKSNVVTNLTVRWTKTDGTQTYQSLGNPTAATSWTQRKNTITIPTGVKSMTIFHVIKSVGTLDIDNFSLVSLSTSTTTSTPVDAVVSAWGSWTAVGVWSVCTSGSQSRTEERTRTVVTATSNGGLTPTLKETRIVNQTCVVGSTPTAPTPTTTTSSLNFPKKEWGAYVGWQETAMDSFESTIGKSALHRAVFIHWGNESAFPTYLKPYVKDKGKVLTIFWEATNYLVGTVNQINYNYDSVLSGSFDSYFSKFASDAKAYGGEVILIPFSEMNGDWFPWSITQNGNTPQKHINAWRKIHGFFADVPNVKFGWAPNHNSVPDTSVNQFENFYPGDDYVDYVGLDGFNFSSPWVTFDQLFGDAIKRMKVYKKPIYIFSFATASGTNKPAWITDALTVQIPKYPEIKGWIWFNESKERDWRVTADSTSLSAFKTALP